MRIDLSCPAEILRIDPPVRETPYGILTLFNLDSRSIVSCEVTLRLLDREGTERGRAVHRARALAGRPHTAFLMSVPLDPPGVPVHGEATLDKVWFEDNDVWRKNADREIEYQENTLEPGNTLNGLKFAAGEDAVGFPDQQPGLWVCVCGRPNPDREPLCLRCQRPKSMIFARYSRQEVERAVSQRQRQLDLESRLAREEDNRLQRLREEEYNEQRKKRRRRRLLLLALAGALAVCAGMQFFGLPALRLLSAKGQTEAGNYEQALAVLEELGSFPGAEKAKRDCETRIARRDAGESRDPEVLLAAAAKLRGGEAEDRALADQADFVRAEIMQEAGDPAGAEALLRTLPEDFPGREERIRACVYDQAIDLLEAREYERAGALFASLGSYMDAEDRAKSCVYEPALMRMEEGKYDEAVDLLSGLEGFLDSGEQIRRAHYLKGYTLERAGDPEGAREAYLQAGDYEDAKERAGAILMAKADALSAAGDYTGAIALYRELDGDPGALEKWQSAAYSLSALYFHSREYQSIIALLDQLPEQTEETEKLRNRAIYQAALGAQKQGNLPEAIALLERIPEDRDAESLLRSWRYELALELMEEERWEEAISLLEKTEGYRRTEGLLKEAREKLAALQAPAETPVPETPAETENTGA